MIGALSKNFHGVGIGPLSKILAVRLEEYNWGLETEILAIFVLYFGTNL